MNTIFSKLLKSRIDHFKNEFTNDTRHVFVDPKTGVLRHPGEFGAYRESVLRDFLQICVPSRLDIGTGFLLTYDGDVSTQADIIIFDKSAAPRIESDERQRFFPVEAVCAFGEVKSLLKKADLKDALNKLARVKIKFDTLSSNIALFRDRSMKQDIKFSREEVVYDQPISFLVCEGFDFDFDSLQTEVSTWYDDEISSRHKHNLVLSIRDGLLTYVDGKSNTFMYPPTRAFPTKNRFIKSSGEDMHINLFCDFMFQGTSSTTIIYPEMNKYMPSLSGGVFRDE
jgi:hypothetical protein